MKASIWRVAAAIFATLLLTTPLRAQVATGTILGNVKDTSGAAVPGAQVMATNVDTQFSRVTTTDASGQYALRLLPLGNYKIDVTLMGSRTSRRQASPSRWAAAPASTRRSISAPLRKSCRSSPTRRSSRLRRARFRGPSFRTTS